jgi:hypothetical protein
MFSLAPMVAGLRKPSPSRARSQRYLPHLTPAEEKEMEELNPKSPQELKEEQEEREFLSGGVVHQKSIQAVARSAGSRDPTCSSLPIVPRHRFAEDCERSSGQL